MAERDPSGPDADALADVDVVDLSLNVPGPAATARLRDLGADVVKVEPPAGDPLAAIAPRWYEELAAGKRVLSLDLKTEAGRRRLTPLLEEADLLVSSFRPGALRRLGLGWDRLHRRHPSLCHVAIVGHPGPARERSGHDLTYQAAAGLLDPEAPRLPRSLHADLTGAERAASAALAALLRRRGETGSAAGCRVEVALSEAAEALRAPLAHGLTSPGGWLGGGNPLYGLYRSRDGWVALAALEERLWGTLLDALGEEEVADDREVDRLRRLADAAAVHPAHGRPAGGDAGATVTDDTEDSIEALRSALAAIFARRSGEEWGRLARGHRLPVEPVAQGLGQGAEETG